MSEHTTLLRCPFCNGTPELRETGGWSGIGCNTNKCPAYLHALMFKTTAEAVSTWNRRASTRGMEKEGPSVRYDGLYEYAQQHRLDYNELCRVVRDAAQATPQTDHPARRCPTCNGDDMQAPCAYPGEEMPGCLRDKRLAASVQGMEAQRLTDEELHALAMASCGVMHGDVLHMGRKQCVSFARKVLAAAAPAQSTPTKEKENDHPARQRPVCTYASGCACDVPRPLPQGNKAWHCPKQQEWAAEVWNSMSTDEGRAKP